MRLDSQRTLTVTAPPEEVWALLADPARLPALAPEIEDVRPTRDGLLRVVARLGRRRRTWNVRRDLDDEKRRLELTSQTEGVHFRLVATVEKAEKGSKVAVTMELVPPEVWKATPLPDGIPRRVVQRLLLSVVLFVLSAFGVVELPSLQMPPIAEAFAYAVVGLSFVMGAALLSSAHPHRKSKGRRRFLPKLGGGRAKS